MSVVPLSSATLFGTAADRAPVLAALQELGCLHVVSLGPVPPGDAPAPSGRDDDAHRALSYLGSCGRQRRPVTQQGEAHFGDVVRRALVNEHHRRTRQDRRDFLVRRIGELRPWGDFSFPSLDEIGDQKLWFYIVPHYQMRKVGASGLTWDVVHRDSNHAYVVVVSPDEPEASRMPVARTHAGAVRLSELEQELEHVEIEIEELDGERESLTRWVWLLRQDLARSDDAVALATAETMVLEDGDVFAVQGWVPVDAVDELEALARSRGLALGLTPPAHDDHPPTLLDNPPGLAGGEEVVRFYQVPGYDAWDPSTLVFFSFAVFFAMILADAGYALVLGLTLTLTWRRLGRTSSGQRVRIMAGAVVISSMIYGVLAGSYFGASPRVPLLRALQLLDPSDFDSMMRLSVVVGSVHLFLANGLVAWHRRARLAALAPLGWAAILSGGLGAWLTNAEATREACVAGAAAGGLLVLLFSGEPFPRKLQQLPRHLLSGLLALTGLSKAFGDVLSYMRLFALGLASASLAVTFNRLALDVLDRVPGLGVLLCGIILLLGHALNLALAVVSGVVHGLRLNLIELYNWSVSDDGYPFRPLAKTRV